MIRRKALAGLVVAILFVQVNAASGETGDEAKFHWTTESAEAKKLLNELQARIENFQFGTETLDLARKLVAADPDFAIGVYYLSAVAPPAEGETELEKAVKLSKQASDGERR